MPRNAKLLLAVLLLALGAHSAFALAPTVYLTADDPFGFTSFNAVGNWSNVMPPSAAFGYSNFNSATPTQGSELRTPATGGSFTFAGDSLTIGGVAGYGLPGNQAMLFKGLGGSAASPNIITINNLTLNTFGMLRHASGISDFFALQGSLLINGGAMQVQGHMYVQSLVSGSGTLNIDSPGNQNSQRVVHFTNGANTFSGNIVLTNTTPGDFASPASSRFSLDNTGVLNFIIGSNGVNNSITGVSSPTASIARYDGAFNFDLSGASNGLGDTWAVATVPNQTFGATFTVNGFANAGAGVWNNSANGVTYQFNQSNGRLTVAAVPEPASLALIGFCGVGLALFRRRA